LGVGAELTATGPVEMAMKNALLILSLAMVARVDAQSLDIRGMEFTLASDADSALARLSAKFQLRKDTSCSECSNGRYRLWAMSRGAGGLQGSILIANNRVQSITKYYTDSAVARTGYGDIRIVYSAGMRELHSRGGDNCSMRNRTVRDLNQPNVVNDLSTGLRFEIASDAISGIETDCGKYRLLLQLPHQRSQFAFLWLELTNDPP
jgi:hypothetical protein